MASQHLLVLKLTAVSLNHMQNRAGACMVTPLFFGQIFLISAHGDSFSDDQVPFIGFKKLTGAVPRTTPGVFVLSF
jgi:hypothetical protein